MSLFKFFFVPQLLALRYLSIEKLEQPFIPTVNYTSHHDALATCCISRASLNTDRHNGFANKSQVMPSLLVYATFNATALYESKWPYSPAYFKLALPYNMSGF